MTDVPAECAAVTTICGLRPHRAKHDAAIMVLTIVGITTFVLI